MAHETTESVTETCRAYWEERAESGSQFELERAARQPYTHWLVADARDLVDEGIEPGQFRTDPDWFFDALRNGFEGFVEEAEIDGTHPAGFDQLVIHLIGVSSVDRLKQFGLDDPLTDANTLTTVQTAPITEPPARSVQPASLTYRCPAGHETTVRSPLYADRLLSRCGEPACTNAVFLDDHETRVRSMLRFSVTVDGTELPCVVGGRYAGEGADHAFNSDRVYLTGIPRIRVDSTGAVEPIYEVTQVGPS